MGGWKYETGIVLNLGYLGIDGVIQGMRESHKRTFKYISFCGSIVIIFYAIFKFLNNLDISESTTNSIVIISSIVLLIAQLAPQFSRVAKSISSDDNDIQKKIRSEKEEKL